MSGRRTWVTLVTRSSYTPGVLALKASLDAIGTAYPLLVLVTSALPAEDREILSALGCALHDIEHIPNSSVVASWSSHWSVERLPARADGGQGRCLLQAGCVRSRGLRGTCCGVVTALIGSSAWALSTRTQSSSEQSTMSSTSRCPRRRSSRRRTATRTSTTVRFKRLNCAHLAALCRFKLLLNDDPITTPVLEPPFNDGLNSGMFVARPSVGLFKRILNHVRTDIVIRHNVDGDQGAPALHAHSAQSTGVINHVFRNSIKWLPYLYNAQTHAVHHHPSFLKAALDHGCVIHYTSVAGALAAAHWAGHASRGCCRPTRTRKTITALSSSSSAFSGRSTTSPSPSSTTRKLATSV